MFIVRLKCIPTATNENIVTERTTDGAKPAKIPKSQREIMITITLIVALNRVFGKGFKRIS